MATKNDKISNNIYPPCVYPDVSDRWILIKFKLIES